MVVIGGTATAQAITVAFSPIITRLYGPDAFGVLGVFSSLISILTPIAALCYPHAIVLPPEDEDGLRLVRLAVLIAAGMTVLMAAIIIPCRSRIASLLGLESVASYLLAPADRCPARNCEPGIRPVAHPKEALSC
jgi:O-antigen/teichoic acid export membrane protein